LSETVGLKPTSTGKVNILQGEHFYCRRTAYARRTVYFWLRCVTDLAELHINKENVLVNTLLSRSKRRHHIHESAAGKDRILFFERFGKCFVLGL